MAAREAHHKTAKHPIPINKLKNYRRSDYYNNDCYVLKADQLPMNSENITVESKFNYRIYTKKKK